VLLGQGAGECDAGHVALRHQDLPEQPARSPLFCEGALELGFLEELFLDEHCPERAPGEVGLIHRWKYRPESDRAKRRVA
jgi:hypothetical protein